MSITGRTNRPKKTGKRPVWKVARAAVVAILSVYALYLIAINAFLSTSLFDRVMGADKVSLEIQYTRAWSVFPTTIHAKNLSLRSSDSNVEWILRIDDITFDVSLLSLFRKRFDVSFAHGRGISMRARQKLDQAPFSVDEIAALPPIDGFPSYSVHPAGPPSLETWEDAHYHLWTVDLEGVIAEDVREVWVEKARFLGNARITGRFYLKPIRAAEIGPAHVDIREGQVNLGQDQVLADWVNGTIDTTFYQFDPRTVHNNEVLRFANIATELRASFVDVSKLPIDVPFYVGGSVKAPRITTRIDHGRLVEGTHIDLVSNDASIAAMDSIGTATITATASVTAKDAGLLANVDAVNITLIRSNDLPVFYAPKLHVAADSHDLDLSTPTPFSDAHVAVDLPSVDLNDANILNAYIPRPAPLDIVKGSAHAHAHVEVWRSDQHAAGYGALEADALDVRVAKMRTRGSFRMQGSLGAFHWNERTVDDARADVHVSRALLSSDKSPDKTIVTGSQIALNLRAKHIDLEDPLKTIDEAAFELPDARIVDRDLLRAYLPKGNKLSLATTSPDTAFAAEGHVAIADHMASGDLHAHSKGALGLTFDKSNVAMHARVDATAKVHDWRWERGDLVLDRAAVNVSKIEMTRGIESLASIAHVGVVLSSPSFAFADPLGREVDIKASVDGGKVLDAAAVDAFLPSDASYGLATEDGTYEASAHLMIAHHVAHGHASATAKHMGIHTKPIALVGDASAAIDVVRWDMNTAMMTLGSSRATLTNVRGRVGKKKSDKTPFDNDRQIVAKKIELTASATDLDTAHPSLRGVDAHFIIEDGELADAHALNALLPEGHVISFDSGHARANADVTISSAARTASGAIGVDITDAKMQLHETKLGGNISIRTEVHGFDPDSGALNVSGSHVSMRDVSVTNASSEAQHWAGDIRLDDATLSTATNGPGLTGMLRLDADDARPVLGIVLRDSLPKFLVAFIEMPKLAVRAHLRFAPHVLVLEDVYGEGGSVAFRGSYGLFGEPSVNPATGKVHRKDAPADEETSGAFIVSKGPIAVGVHITKDGAKPHFFGLEKWLATEDRKVKDQEKAKTIAQQAPPGSTK